ncbi:carbohydrate-binding module family 20 domain-containing protein [Actinoalloteichus caeruleus]|uniref:carbohydrate-binding module family 20 domain-containing protein n=1 Tax=Actinoalloteichus cyanogriseus TaxID=2893586 RepID=UPI0005514DBB|nr:carbohydrate-binding module family 20 domain-containing protein [Actinoalloteichus caeruleus]
MRARNVATIATAVLVSMAASSIPVLASDTQASADPTSTPTTPVETTAQANGDTLVHLFQWRWDSIARECEDVLGPAGFGGVQVSPPQEHVVLADDHHPWWQDYQPVSYQLDNTRRGTRADFVDMVETCRDNGVRIYVDAVINHMAGSGSIGSGPGSNGNTFDKYRYPAAGYDDQHFGDCRRDIGNWDNPDEVWHCELLALSDLRTADPVVRGRIADYLNDLVGIGVAGFRVDAAKHMPQADLQAIYGMLDDVPHFGGRPHIYQEVIEGGGPPELKPPAYAHLGQVTEFRYQRQVGPAVRDGNLGWLHDLGGQMALPSGDAVVFVDNHDTQRSDPGLVFQNNPGPYRVASAFMLAHPFGTPKLMSSYRFTNNEQGPPSAGQQPGNPAGAITAPTECGANGWLCEHREPAIAGMVGFRNQVGDAPLTHRWTSGDGRAIAFGRGQEGFAVFNRGGALNQAFRSGLPAGTYCDVATGSRSTGEGTCTGAAVTVAGDGSFQASVPTDGVLALHVGETGAPCEADCEGPPGEQPGQCAFGVRAETWFGQEVHLVGSIPELGSWNPSAGVHLSSSDYPVWRTTVTLPADTAFEYKYVKIAPGGEVEWEPGANRRGSTGGACSFSGTFGDTTG